MKKVLLIIAVLIGLVIILGLVAPNDYNVERDIVINRPKAEVFMHVKSLKSQDQWSVWGQLDPDMKSEYHGTDGTVGFISAWEGNKDVGKGEQEITGIIEGERVDFELRFKEPWESVSQAWLLTQAEQTDRTHVTWGFAGEMKFPMNIMLIFMSMENMIGPDLEQGLQNLKQKMESEPVETPVETQDPSTDL